MKFRLSILAIIMLTVAACSDTAITESGGGTGDTDPQAVAMISPFVGIYDLPDNWSANPPDQAFLEIQSPEPDGKAVALLHDWDDVNNCIPTRASEGVVSKDSFSDRIFLDNLLAFNNAIVTLSGNILTISFEDVNDLDNNGTVNEWINLESPVVNVALISDLGPFC